MRILLIVGVGLAFVVATARAQERPGSQVDTSSGKRPVKSVASKSMAAKSYESKIEPDMLRLKFARFAATESPCTYETNKGFRCKRTAIIGTSFCRTHTPRSGSKETSGEERR